MFVLSCFSVMGQTTSLNYNELGTLISDEGNYGTARFNAMSGAFGALGGDLSSVAVNPAGAVVSLNGKMSLSLDNSSTASQPTFLSKKDIDFNNSNFNLSNAGGVLLFNSYGKNVQWNRFALSFNHQIKHDFNSGFALKGGAERIKPYFIQNPKENIDYNIPFSQIYDRATTGQSTRFNLTFSAVKNNQLYLGASLNFHSFNFGEVAKLEEENANDQKDRHLNAFNVQESNYKGDGLSLSVGAIYRLKNLRLGLALETPTWYDEIVDESNIFKQNYSNSNKEYIYDGFTAIDTFDYPSNGNNKGFDTANDFELISYSFKTPARFTASMAYIFAKSGLISIDYSFRNYNGIRYGNEVDFKSVNRDFSEFFVNTNEVNLGTEWRIKKWSLRGGYHYKQNPNTFLKNSDIQGFSLGFGYNFGFANLDVSYYQDKHTDYFHIYSNNDTWINNNTSKLTGTLSFNL